MRSEPPATEIPELLVQGGACCRQGCGEHDDGCGGGVDVGLPDIAQTKEAMQLNLSVVLGHRGREVIRDFMHMLRSFERGAWQDLDRAGAEVRVVLGDCVLHGRGMVAACGSV